jgi:hypothetical protein
LIEIFSETIHRTSGSHNNLRAQVGTNRGSGVLGLLPGLPK